MGIFDGLETFGFGDEVGDLNLYPVEEVKKIQKKVVPQENPMDYLYRKEVECPVCITQFETYVIRRSKLRVIDTETDLKTRYHTINPSFYDVMICTNCGYAALINYFNHITEKQKELVLEKIYPRFKPKQYQLPLSPESAVERYKMALLCAAVIGMKAGQKAILCLKTAWVFRDMGDKTSELLFLNNALTGLKEAYKSEAFPIGAMDQLTTTYMIGELLRRTGQPAEAMKWISQVAVDRKVTDKLKNRALLVKDLIREGSTT